MTILAQRLLQVDALRKTVRESLRKRITVIMYHGVSDGPLSVYNWCQIPQREFEEQANFIASNYNVLPLVEVVDRIQAESPLPDFTACITFDDAFRSVATNAYPVLQKLHLPFTIFVVSSLLDTGKAPWPERFFSAIMDTDLKTFDWSDRSWALRGPEERSATYDEIMKRLIPMTIQSKDAALTSILDLLGRDPDKRDARFGTLQRDELRQMTATGLAQVGAHSDTHVILTNCSIDEAKQEIELSRSRLREEPGYVDLFAYPNGNFNNDIKGLVRNAGFKGAVTVEHALCKQDTDIFEIPRVGIGAGITETQFATKMLGY